MRAIGCLGVIIIVIVAIFFLTQGNFDQDNASQWVGEKAPRGWNMVRQSAQNARKGWQNVPDEGRRSPRQQDDQTGY